jgi:hypothetical protein
MLGIRSVADPQKTHTPLADALTPWSARTSRPEQRAEQGSCLRACWRRCSAGRVSRACSPWVSVALSLFHPWVDHRVVGAAEQPEGAQPGTGLTRLGGDGGWHRALSALALDGHRAGLHDSAGRSGRRSFPRNMGCGPSSCRHGRSRSAASAAKPPASEGFRWDTCRPRTLGVCPSPSARTRCHPRGIRLVIVRPARGASSVLPRERFDDSQPPTSTRCAAS